MKWGTNGGNVTTDKVFLLSVEELMKYYSFGKYYNTEMYGYSSSLVIASTEYAKQRNVSYTTIDQYDYDNWYLGEYGYSTDIIGQEGTWWWLRTPGMYGDWACNVHGDGMAGWGGESYIYERRGGVRPALYITL